VRKLIQPKVARRILDRAGALSTSRFQGVESVARKIEGNLDLSFITKNLQHAKRDVPLELVDHLKKEKDRIRVDIECLKEGVNDALGQAKLEGIIVVVSSTITALATLSAAAWSNPLGAITTVAAGGSATSFTALTSDSLKSYFSLKAKYRIRIRKLESQLEHCDEDACLERIDKEVEDMNKYLIASLDEERTPSSSS
jgi:hypothetical protein